MLTKTLTKILKIYKYFNRMRFIKISTILRICKSFEIIKPLYENIENIEKLLNKQGYV